MRFLSTRRKHPAAKPLTLLLALFLMGAVYSVVSPAQKSVADTATSWRNSADATGVAAAIGIHTGSSSGTAIVAAATAPSIAAGRASYRPRRGLAASST